MPNYNQVNKYTVTAAGDSINLDVLQSNVTRYVFSGTSTLVAGYSVQATGTPVEGMEFDIRWQAPTTTSGANVVTIFGTTLTTAQALTDLIISVYYNGSAWDVDITEDTSTTLWAVGAGSNSTTLISGVNTVSGTRAFSAGTGCTSSGTDSVSFGNASVASGTQSLAVGAATASATNSTAIGPSTTTATANFATAIGDNCDASGTYSGSFGRDNQVSGSASFSLGEDCDITGNQAFSTGYSNLSSGDTSFTSGTNNTASSADSTATGNNTYATAQSSFSGGLNSRAERYGQFSRGSGSFGVSTDYAQYSFATALISTTDATPTVLKLDGSGTNFLIPENSGGIFEVKVFAVQQAGAAGTVGDVASWNFNGTIKNISGTTALVDTVRYQDNTGAWGASASRSQDAGAATWAVAATANNTNDSLDITVTGEVNKTIYWEAYISFTEIKYTP